MNRTEQAGVPLAAAGLAVMGLVGGCSAAGHPGAGTVAAGADAGATGRGTASGSSSSPAPASGPSAAAAKAVAAAQQAALVVNQPQARKDVTLASCRKDGADWTAIGVITNPGPAARYTVVVSFVDAHWTVLSRATTTVTVAGHDAHSWRAAAAVPSTAAVTCVLRGVARA